jgi:hypothetical protein
MMKVYDYRIVKAKNTGDLSQDVVKAIAEGWQPLGPPFGTRDDSTGTSQTRGVEFRVVMDLRLTSAEIDFV